MMLQRLKSPVIPTAYSLPADLLSAGVAPVAASAAPLRLSAGDRPSAIARQAITEFGGRPAPSTRRPPFPQAYRCYFSKIFPNFRFLVRRQSHLVQMVSQNFCRSSNCSISLQQASSSCASRAELIRRGRWRRAGGQRGAASQPLFQSPR